MRLVFFHSNSFLSGNKYISKKKISLYLSLVPVVYLLLYNNNLNKIVHNSLVGGVIFYLFFLILGLTIGWDDVSPFLKKDKSFREIVDIAIYILVFQNIIIIIISNLIDKDPQGIKNIQLSTNQFIFGITELPLIAIGEELFKFFLFIAFLSLLRVLPKIQIPLSIALTCFFFGYGHVFNYKWTAWLPIFLSSIPYLVFLVKERTLYPLILAHFITDGVFLLYHYNILVYQLMIFSIFIIYLYRSTAKSIKELMGNFNL